jgi:uncharacterized membrane protein YbhN (UPF0104 family)
MRFRPWLFQGISYAILLVALAFAAVLSLKLLGKHDIAISHPAQLVPALLAEIASILCGAMAWRMIANGFTGSHLSLPEATSHQGMILVSKYVPGKFWGLIGRWAAMIEKGASTKAIAEATLLEQTIVLATGCVMGAGALFYYLPARFIVLVAFILVCLFVFRKPLVAFLIWMCSKMGFQGSLRGLRVRLRERGLSDTMRATAAVAIQWGLACTAYLFVLRAVNVSLSAMDALLVASTLPAAVVAGFLVVIAPGGVGVREGVLAVMLAPILGFELAVLSSLIYRFLTVARDILFGVYSVLFMRFGAH